MVCWEKYTVTSVWIILFVLQSCVCTEISRLNISGYAFCDNIMEFYADGVRYEHYNDYSSRMPSPINIPYNTHVVAIRCDNLSHLNGIKVGLSNGIKTDATWKCSDEEVEGWQNVTFDDGSWRNAAVLPGRIWTTSNRYTQGTIYCRKTINGLISHQNITGYINCDYLDVYADGVQYEHHNDQQFGLPSFINIPGKTQLLAIKCKTYLCQGGLSAALSIGVKTDTSWKCSNEEVEGWNTVGFDDRIWMNATVLQFSNDWIWATENMNQVGVIYCRKTLIDSISSYQSSVKTTLLESVTTPITDFDLQPSPTGVAVVGSDGVLRSEVCQDVVVVTSESAMKEEGVASIYKELTVDKSKMSSVIRKKVSQKDERPSSTTIGYFGLIFAILPLVLIIMSDIPKVILYLKTLRPNKH